MRDTTKGKKKDIKRENHLHQLRIVRVCMCVCVCLKNQLDVVIYELRANSVSN